MAVGEEAEEGGYARARADEDEGRGEVGGEAEVVGRFGEDLDGGGGGGGSGGGVVAEEGGA